MVLKCMFWSIIPIGNKEYKEICVAKNPYCKLDCKMKNVSFLGELTKKRNSDDLMIFIMENVQKNQGRIYVRTNSELDKRRRFKDEYSTTINNRNISSNGILNAYNDYKGKMLRSMDQFRQDIEKLIE